MVLKAGRFGRFIACSGYPDCRNTKNIQEGPPVPCPKCGEGTLTARRSRRGKFYGCSRYPDCDFTSRDLPAAPAAAQT
jgi:DNA topoisomerase-1